MSWSERERKWECIGRVSSLCYSYHTFLPPTHLTIYGVLLVTQIVQSWLYVFLCCFAPLEIADISLFLNTFSRFDGFWQFTMIDEVAYASPLLVFIRSPAADTATNFLRTDHLNLHRNSKISRKISKQILFWSEPANLVTGQSYLEMFLNSF